MTIWSTDTSIERGMYVGAPLPDTEAETQSVRTIDKERVRGYGEQILTSIPNESGGFDDRAVVPAEIEPNSLSDHWAQMPA